MTDGVGGNTVGPADGDIRSVVSYCLDMLPIGVFILDDQLTFLYANEELARINGCTVADHVGHGLLEVLPQIAPVSFAALQETMRTGQPVDDLLVDRMLTARRSYSLSYRRMTMPDGRYAVFGSIADVSERARGAELARNLGERLGRLRDANVIGVIVAEGTRIIDVNGYVLEMLGRTREELAAGSLDLSELTPPEFAEQDARVAEEMRQHGACAAFTKDLLHADGRRVPVVMTGTAFDVEPLRWLVLVLDMSTMRRSERRAASLIRIATELATARQLDDVLALVPLLADPLSGLEARIVPGDDSTAAGAPRFADRQITIPILDGTDRPAAVVELRTSREIDVYERSFATAAEALLSASATQISYRDQRRMAELAGALDAMLDPVAIDTAIRDEQGEIVDFRVQWVNRATSDAFGRTATEMIGSTMLTLYPELRGSAFFEAHRKVVEQGEPFEDPEFLFVPSSPGIPSRVYEMRVSKFGDGFISCNRDVTERAEAARLVRRSQQQLEAAQSLARIGSWEWNIDTGESAWSRELYRLMAVDPATPEDELGRASQERIHPDDRHLYEEAIAAAVAHSRPFRFEQRLVLPAGERLAVVTGEVTHDERGRVVRGTVRDVTEWRKAQDESAHGRLALEAMQAACLPASMPEAPGIELDARYRPAHEGDRLGGDWYDAFALPDGRVGLVVGDVTGHGLAAAGIMSQLRNALRAFASDGATPAVVLDAVARFQRQQAIDTLATCLYVVLDPRDGSFEWARAGHPPLLVVGPDTWTSFEVGGGPPLGVSGPGYAGQREVLPPGALLVLYTDGLVEERSETIDVGIAALGSFVGDRRDRPVSLIVDEAVEALGANRTSIDDVCLLLVRRNGA